MSRNRTYRCLNCLERTVSREFDVPHLSVTCPNCDSFERFVNDAVFQQFRAFEESPPAEIDWERLDRTEKLMVSERLVRSTKTLADFDVVEEDAPAESGEAPAESGEAPAESEEAPTESEEAPTESEEAPAGNGEPSTGDKEASAEGGEASAGD